MLLILDVYASSFINFSAQLRHEPNWDPDPLVQCIMLTSFSAFACSKSFNNISFQFMEMYAVCVFKTQLKSES